MSARRLGPTQRRLLRYVADASSGYVESPDELRVLRVLTERGLVEARRGYWYATDEGRAAARVVGGAGDAT
jgi:hypothetical protein